MSAPKLSAETRRYWLCAALDCLLVLWVCFGVSYVFASGFDLPFTIGRLLLLSLVGAVLGVGVCAQRKRLTVCIALALPLMLLLYLVLAKGDAVMEGFRALVAGVWSRFFTALPYDVTPCPLPIAPEGAEGLALLLPAGLLLSVLYGLIQAWALLRQHSPLLSAALTLPPLLLPLLFYYYPPDAAALTILFAYYALLLLTTLLRRGEAPRGSVLTLCLAPVALAAVLLANFLSTRIPLPQFDSQLLFDKLNSVAQSWDGAVSSLTGDVGASEVNLAAVGPKDTSTDPVLVVTASESGTLYLRSNSYAVYDGSSWSEASEPYDEACSLSFTADALAAVGLGGSYRVDVQTVRAHSLLFVPYFLYSPSSEVLVAEDKLTAVSGAVSRYTWTCWSGSADWEVLGLSLPARENEMNYRRYVETQYLALPDDTRAALESYIDVQNLDRFGSRAEIVEAVSEHVRSCAAYTLTVSRMPYGRDFALYFLEESHEGYCVHFASAATVLLRAMGVPARYVTGYKCSAAAGEAVTVTREDSHAWVEVYYDGVGWIPIEATGSLDSSAFATAEPTATTEPTFDPSYEPTAAPDTGDEPSPASPTPSAAPSPSAIGGTGTDTPSGDEPNAPSGKLSPWWLLLALPLVAALLIWLRRYLILRERRLRQHRYSPTRRVLADWRLIERLSRYGVHPPEAIRAIANKAAFAPYAPNAEDCAAIGSYRDEQLDRLKKTLPLWQRLVARWLRCLF